MHPNPAQQGSTPLLGDEMNVTTMAHRCGAALWALSAAAVLCAQDPAKAPPPPVTGHEVSAAEIAKANNPLADVNALTFENYYDPTLYGLSNVSANTLDLRAVIVSGRQIIRATLPIQTTPVGQGQSKSGLGDAAIFDAIRISPNGAKNEFAVGPLLVAPSATNSALGSGKWQGGVAAVAILPLSPGSIWGVLATWQHSFAGNQDRSKTQVSTLQPFATYSIGGGYYIRSSGVMVFDFQNNRYIVPFGAGFGKAVRVGNGLVNAFVEPQFTVYHKGVGQPSFQLYAGIKWQWAKPK
jgi:hypothetical protein